MFIFKASFGDKSKIEFPAIFQLAQVDFDGAVTVKATTSVNCNTDNTELDINYIISSGNSLEISISSTLYDDVNIAVYNMEGKIISETTSQITDGEANYITIDVGNIASGIYFLRLCNNTISVNKIFVIAQ